MMMHPWKIGSAYCIRTVTMCVTGIVREVFPQEILLTQAAWIADTGRFNEAVRSGDFAEVEPFPDERSVILGRGAVIDAVEIPSAPRKVK